MSKDSKEARFGDSDSGQDDRSSFSSLLPVEEDVERLELRSPSSGSLADRPILPILAYCGSSILMTVTNKYVLSGLDFNLNFVLLAVQAVVCIAAIQTCKWLAVISYRDFDTGEAKRWFPISILLVGMIYTGTKALQYLSIPVYTIFKNLTIIFIAYGEVIWFSSSITRTALMSFILMCVSSIIAAWADIKAVRTSDDAEKSTKMSTLNAGYAWMLVNCFCSAAYVLGMRKRIKLFNFSDFDTMFYNNLLSIPVIILCSLVVEDWSFANIARNFPIEKAPAIALAMLVSGLCAVFISYTTAWCIRVTTATTFSMVGALNKLPIALSGLVFFHTPVTLESVSAIALGFVSGIIYTTDKIRQKKQSSKPTVADEAGSEQGEMLVPLNTIRVDRVSEDSGTLRDTRENSGHPS